MATSGRVIPNLATGPDNPCGIPGLLSEDVIPPVTEYDVRQTVSDCANSPGLIEEVSYYEFPYTCQLRTLYNGTDYAMVGRLSYTSVDADGVSLQEHRQFPVSYRSEFMGAVAGPDAAYFLAHVQGEILLERVDEPTEPPRSAILGPAPAGWTLSNADGFAIFVSRSLNTGGASATWTQFNWLGQQVGDPVQSPLFNTDGAIPISADGYYAFLDGYTEWIRIARSWPDGSAHDRGWLYLTYPDDVWPPNKIRAFGGTWGGGHYAIGWWENSEVEGGKFMNFGLFNPDGSHVAKPIRWPATDYTRNIQVVYDGTYYILGWLEDAAAFYAQRFDSNGQPVGCKLGYGRPKQVDFGIGTERRISGPLTMIHNGSELVANFCTTERGVFGGPIYGALMRFRFTPP